ncbi:hypothetical protein KSP40_PGU005729 [Platanthera guangdongensis]|uniref:Leucine-rich repeat-containing N-terminal plant-type domain-containing protein n=1 Tax=Platanthera guangdongensis TaxID=2320717 RepID=A0ABR2MHG8_9ASPA
MTSAKTARNHPFMSVILKRSSRWFPKRLHSGSSPPKRRPAREGGPVAVRPLPGALLSGEAAQNWAASSLPDHPSPPSPDGQLSFLLEVVIDALQFGRTISFLHFFTALALALAVHLSSALTPDGTFSFSAVDSLHHPSVSHFRIAGKALLELKDGWNDTKRMLRSWRGRDPNPCGWAGVTCHFPDLRVRSMSVNLPYMLLGGIISPSIGKLTRLRRLCMKCRDLSSNLLGGTIPPSIGQLMQLHFLNLSTNFFSGEIPNVGVLGKFRNSSFVGNLELCGFPIQKKCRGTLGFPAVLPRTGSFPSEALKGGSKKSQHFLASTTMEERESS